MAVRGKRAINEEIHVNGNGVARVSVAIILRVKAARVAAQHEMLVPASRWRRYYH